MSNRTAELSFIAVRSRLESERNRALAILQNYWSNPVAIGEHSDLPEEIYKALCELTEAEDRLIMLARIALMPETSQPIVQLASS